ncbi:UNVERIFIED_CONTAM: DUF4097 and DUF4098 domain-containing protein YvlB [Acetivibrio alkalicellulosi]
MSLSEEKMYILKMLEEGKISSEQAARLIEALDPDKKSDEREYSGKQDKKVNFNEEVNKVKDRLNDWKKEFKKNYSQKDFDKAVEDFGVKMEKVGKNLAHTTVGFADKVVDFVGSFIDTNAFNVFGNYKAVTRTFEIEYVNDNTEIEIEGLNGNILVKKHMEDKVIIRSIVKSPQDNADEILTFSHNEDNAKISYNKIGNISVSHEVFLPTIKVKSIKLVTKNGKIYVEDSLADTFEAITSNSNIDLMGVTCNKLNVSTKNGKIQFGYIIGSDINIDANNSVIDIKHIKTENINVVTRNGKVLVENIHHCDNSSTIDLKLKTANAGIKVNMNDMDMKGYKVKAHTTNGEINLLIPDMTYRNVSKQMKNNFIEAQSNDYDNHDKKVNIIAETINGYIEIVK